MNRDPMSEMILRGEIPNGAKVIAREGEAMNVETAGVEYVPGPGRCFR